MGYQTDKKLSPNRGIHVGLVPLKQIFELKKLIKFLAISLNMYFGCFCFVLVERERFTQNEFCSKLLKSQLAGQEHNHTGYNMWQYRMLLTIKNC